MVTLFQNYAGLVVFLHVFFAIVWVGGMIALRFAVHQALVDNLQTDDRLKATVAFLDKFLKMAGVAAIVMGVTGVTMMIGMNLKANPSLYAIAHLKTQIYTVMVLVLGYVYFRFYKAKKALLADDFSLCGTYLKPIATWLIPLNIALGVALALLGVTLRGF